MPRRKREIVKYTVRIPVELEEGFRLKARDVYGDRQGYLTQALEDAIRRWVDPPQGAPSTVDIGVDMVNGKLPGDTVSPEENQKQAETKRLLWGIPPDFTQAYRSWKTSTVPREQFIQEAVEQGKYTEEKIMIWIQKLEK